MSEELYRETGPKNNTSTLRPFIPRKSIQAVTQTNDDEQNEVVNEDMYENAIESEQIEVDCEVVQSRPNGRRFPDRNKSERAEGNVDTSCFNCGENSHRFLDCKQPITRAFCFRCGKKDVITPRCDCIPKNSRNVAQCNQQLGDETTEQTED